MFWAPAPEPAWTDFYDHNNSLLFEIIIQFDFNVAPEPESNGHSSLQLDVQYMWGGVGEDDEADEGVPIGHYYENKQRLNSLMQQLKFPFPPVCL